MFKLEKTDNGYVGICERIVAERSKEVDNLILGEIRKIAIDNGIETKIILNEKNVVEALRNYQDGYKSIKVGLAREIFAEIEEHFYNNESQTGVLLYEDFAELKKKYIESEKENDNGKFIDTFLGSRTSWYGSWNDYNVQHFRRQIMTKEPIIKIMETAEKLEAVQKQIEELKDKYTEESK